MSETRLRRLKYVGTSLFLALVYIGTAKLGLGLAIVQANATAVWAPTGIAIAVLLILGYSYWPAIFIAAFFVNATTMGTSVPAATGIAIGNTLEALVAVYLVRRTMRGQHPLERVDDVFWFSLCAGIVGPAVSATIGTGTLALSGALSLSHYFSAWATWWLGDLGGALVVAPLILIWNAGYPILWRRDKITRGVVLCAAVAFFSYFILHDNAAFVYLAFPLLVWMAFTFGQRVIATGMFAMTEVLFWGTVRGYGPFILQANHNLNDALILLDVVMASISVTMLAFAAVVEENKKVRMGLELEKATDEAVLANMEDAFIVVNQAGEILIVNPRAEALLGISRNEVVGRDFFSTIIMERENGVRLATEERPLFRALQGKRASNDPFVGLEYFVRKDGGRFLVSCVAVPVVIEGAVVGAIEYFRDMTAEQEANQAKTDLIALASHQLRTPLSVIGLSSELLQGQGTLFGTHERAEMESYAKDIQVATRQMMEIVNDLLAVSRLEAKTLVARTEPVDIGRIMRQSTDGIMAKAKQKRIRMTVRISDTIGQFVTDPALFTIIIQNLISNAVKYANEDGLVEVSLAEEGGNAIIIVSDSGRGIPRAEQPRVFDKFFRATNAVHSSSEGTGLGLYITKSMVEQLGGTISFASEEGQGSTFVVRLPSGGGARHPHPAEREHGGAL